MLEQEIELLRNVAKAWNNLDSCFIENELADNLIYKSQWVLAPIEGKKEFLTYLQSKFSAIKLAMMSERISVRAELAFHPDIENSPCIVVTQTAMDGIREVLILIRIGDKKITRIDVCFKPDPADANLTGEFP